MRCIIKRTKRSNQLNTMRLKTFEVNTQLDGNIIMKESVMYICCPAVHATSGQSIGVWVCRAEERGCHVLYELCHPTTLSRARHH